MHLRRASNVPTGSSLRAKKTQCIFYRISNLCITGQLKLYFTYFRSEIKILWSLATQFGSTVATKIENRKKRWCGNFFLRIGSSTSLVQPHLFQNFSARVVQSRCPIFRRGDQERIFFESIYIDLPPRNNEASICKLWSDFNLVRLRASMPSLSFEEGTFAKLMDALVKRKYKNGTKRKKKKELVGPGERGWKGGGRGIRWKSGCCVNMGPRSE